MRLISIVMLLALLASPNTSVLAKDQDGRKPPTKVTEKISPAVFKVLEQAQTALEARQFNEAEAIVQELRADQDRLNDYERAQALNFLAAIHYEQGKTDATIDDYIAIIKLENPPEQLMHNSLFRLAQLYFVTEDYARSIKVLDKWMSLQTGVRPEAHMLKAQAYYQMEQYSDAEAPILAALKEARRRNQDYQESWLALLRAVYYEMQAYPKAVKVLDQLIQRWPQPSYYKQLAGMLGLMGQQKGQLYAMHAAYVGGMLENEFELLNMARLYMAEDAPYPAIELMQAGLQSGDIEENADNLQLLAQAMSLAKAPELQIPVLQKAARLSGDARQYLYLGQAQIALYRWEEAAESLQQALKIGLDRPGGVYMQLGTANYNLKRHGPALQAFKQAAAYPDHEQQARQWLRFVQAEIQRRQAMDPS